MRLTKARLAALKHVEVQLTPTSVSALAASYAELGVARDVVVVVPTFTAAAAIVLASDLVATLPESVVAGTGLRVLSSPVPTEVQPIHLVWHQRTEHDPAQRAFRDLVIRALAPGSGRAPKGRSGAR